MKYRYISHRLQLIKSFNTGVGKSAVIFPAAFFVATGTGMVALGIIFYLRKTFGASASEIGLLSALWYFFYVIGCLFVRPLFNRVLPRYLLIASTFIMMVTILSIIPVKKIIYVYYLYGFLGISMSLFWPSISGWLSQGYEGQKLSRIMSGYNFSWSIGTIISPLLAGLLSSINKSLPIFIGSMLFFVTTLLLIGTSFSLPKIKSDKWIDIISKDEAKKVDKSTPLRYLSWIGIFSSYVVIGVIFNVFPVYARQNLGMSEKIIGLLLQQRAIFATIGFIILGRTVFWHFNWIQMIFGQLFLGVVTYLLGYVHGDTFIGIIFGLIGFIMSLSYFNSVFHGVSGSPRRSTRMAINESLISFGQIIGALVGSIIYENISMRMVYLFCSLLVFFMSFVQLVLIYYFYKNDLLKKPSL